MRNLLTTTVATAALAATAAAPLAQPAAIARDAAPLTLRSGFTPDPRDLPVQAGGPRDTSTLPDCAAGVIGERPTQVVDYRGGGSAPLIVSVQSESDTTLAIQGPDGAWRCNDDSETGGLNPEIALQSPAGRYAIHVGLLAPEGQTAPATLRLSATRRAERQAAVVAAEAEAARRRVRPSPEAAPGQSVDLRAGFRPNPRDLAVQAGGGLDSIAIRDDCNGGYITSAPTARLTYAAGDGPLVMSVQAEGDTTLVVRGPDGAYTCNDDGPGSLQPQIVLERPASGRYDVWVGRFGTPDDLQPATLRLSGVVPPPPPPEPEVPAEGPAVAPQASNWRLSPTYRTLSLRAGFKPDPAEVDVYAGGDRDASAQEGCNGVVSDAPSVRLDYRNGAHPLIVTVRSEADTTLMVRGPDGRFQCNDDADGLNPRVIVERPRSGRYDIWVGRFNAADLAPATLRVSEMVERTPPPPPVVGALTGD